MKRWALSASLIVFHQFHSGDARACGATLEVIEPVLPITDASGVPLDAALMAAGNLRAISAMVLRRVDAGVGSGARAEGDAGATSTGGTALESTVLEGAGLEGTRAGDSGALDVEVGLECHQGPSGYLCVGTPASTLLPNTTYEWSASTEQSGSAPLAMEPRRFTTGSGLAETGNPEVQISLTEYMRVDAHPCGLQSYASVAISATEAAEPLVVHAIPLYPSAMQLVAVLTPSAAEQSVALYNLSECSTLKGFDVTGRPLEFGEVCPEDLGVGTPAPADSTGPAGSGEQTTADSTAASDRGASSRDEAAGEEGISRRGVASGSDSGCAVAGVSTVTRRRADGAVWFVVGLLCLTTVRLRRRLRTSPAGVLAPR